jgi:hypothetical protein
MPASASAITCNDRRGAPVSLQTVTLAWDLTDLIRSGLSATLSITPTAQMSDPVDHVLIAPVARAHKFSSGTGQLAGIIANDSTDILPAYDPPNEPGAGYLISVTAADGQVIVPQFQTQLLYGNGATQWLDGLAVVPVVATAYQYLPNPVGGAPANGQVPTAVVADDDSWSLAWQPNGTGADKTFTQPFTVADTVSVAHDLSKYPAVTVIDSAGSVVIGDVDYTDLNNLTVSFSAPFSGTVTCN